MSRKRIIEGTWSCAECGATVKGRHKECTQCGSPREQGEHRFDFGPTRADGSAHAASVRDKDLLDDAGAGQDWHCNFCESANRGDAEVCQKCGAHKHAKAPSAPAAHPDPPAEHSSRIGLAALGAPVLTTLSVVLGLSVCIGGALWVTRDVEVQASVSERRWIREVRVERLYDQDVESWQEEMEPPAAPPGSPTLRAGRGDIRSCATVACWPRPPAGQSTARVIGPRWRREVTVARFETRRRQGWRNEVPSRGSLPTAGSGGRPGVDGSPSCHRKERTPERCRTVSRREQCGTEQKCTVRNLGNGYAEETCTDVPKYCTVRDEECTPATYDDYCTWTEIYSGQRTTHEATGTSEPARWPTFPSARNARIERTERYVVELEGLAGPAVSEFKAPDEATMRAAQPKRLVFVGPSLTAVPKREWPATHDAKDCGDAVPRGQANQREWCTWQRWTWTEEPLRRATGKGQAPEWPDGQLGDNGREHRTERIEVDLQWARGRQQGHKTLDLEVADWEAWPEGHRLGVVVDHQSNFVQFAP